MELVNKFFTNSLIFYVLLNLTLISNESKNEPTIPLFPIN
jgi:hypothetical protein